MYKRQVFSNHPTPQDPVEPDEPQQPDSVPPAPPAGGDSTPPAPESGTQTPPAVTAPRTGDYALTACLVLLAAGALALAALVVSRRRY